MAIRKRRPSLRFSECLQTSTSDNSKRIRCNLVHEKTTLSPTRHSKKMYDLFFPSLHHFGITEKWHFEDYTTNIGQEIWRVWLWDTLPSTLTSNSNSKGSYVFHKFTISRSSIAEWAFILEQAKISSPVTLKSARI